MKAKYNLPVKHWYRMHALSEERHRCTAGHSLSLVLSFLLLQLRYSAQSLFDYMKKIQNDSSAMEGFCETLLKVFEDNLRNDR